MQGTNLSLYVAFEFTLVGIDIFGGGRGVGCFSISSTKISPSFADKFFFLSFFVLYVDASSALSFLPVKLRCSDDVDIYDASKYIS